MGPGMMGGRGMMDGNMPMTTMMQMMGMMGQGGAETSCADMSGMAAWGEEADLYRFHAHKGQRLRFTVSDPKKLRFSLWELGSDRKLHQLLKDWNLGILILNQPYKLLCQCHRCLRIAALS